MDENTTLVALTDAERAYLADLVTFELEAIDADGLDSADGVDNLEALQQKLTES